jgi:hypothetical protein
MTTSDVLAVAAAVIVAIFVGALAFALVSVTRTLRVLRTTVEALREEMVPLAGELRDAARAAGDEVDRVDRLVTSAERLEDAVDSASRFAHRTIANPVVKAMAIGTGVSRATHRLRDGDRDRDRSSTEALVPVKAGRAVKPGKSERRRWSRRAS